MTNTTTIRSPSVLVGRVEVRGAQWIEALPAGGVLVHSDMSFTVKLAGLGDAARPESGRLVMLLFFSTRPADGLVCDPSVAPCGEEDDEPR